MNQAQNEAAQADATNKSATKTDSTTEAKSVEKQEFSFFKSMKTAEQASEKITFEDMKSRLQDIQKKGSLLKQHPMPDMVKNYISEVRDFLTDLREGAYASNERDGVFQKIDVVDEKLDQLANQVLEEEKEGFELADSLGELQGLLIDILV